MSGNVNPEQSSIGTWRDSPARALLFEKYKSKKDGEVTLVVPPVAMLDRPNLSLHILESCAARDADTGVNVFYANLPFGCWIGENVNIEMCYLHPRYLLCERLFSAAAFGVPLMGNNAEAAFNEFLADIKGDKSFILGFEGFMKLAREIEYFINDIAEIIVEFGSKIVGCTSIFEQRASSAAILNAVKRLSQETVTIIGGANCTEEMAEGMGSLGASIDYIFSGECETVFPDFLKQWKAGNLPKEKIIKGTPCLNMDDIPAINYDEFYRQQADLVQPLPENFWLPYETSRGCWWGEKTPCTFCGLNGLLFKYRQKSPEHVMAQLKQLIDAYKPGIILNCDNIMPFSFFEELLPQLNTAFPGVQFYYEQKANINLKRMLRLKEANVHMIQPGIEGVSTSLLKRMNKGIKGSQNITMMRYARSCGIALNWNLLYAFPGDRLEEYEETLGILRHIRHLSPPFSMDTLDFERFSMYCIEPDSYKILDMKPLSGYYDILPEKADVNKVAYNMTCHYDSCAFEHPEIVRAINDEILAWRAAWVHDGDVHTPRILKVSEQVEKDGYPILHITEVGENRYQLVDTRQPGCREQRTQILDREQALAALGYRSMEDDTLSRAVRDWAIENRFAIEMDNAHVPLATASPGLIARFENKD